ncbi:hypothetical protein [Methylogaea oryzae]|uniref:hypothetical protein n=1 Tax=Methylogaea oryzae TaxID=1295382 RepID=UPI000B051CC3|nr:hypothetical protein [Methylogaea oryzae]
MNRRIVFTLLSGVFYCSLVLGLAGCAPAKSTWQRAVEVAAKLAGKAPPPVEVKVESGSEQQCQAVDPVEPGTCYTPKYAGGALCQPQCIPYARCRTGSTSCQLGNTSPVQWFLCEQERGYTSAIPRPGSLLAIGIHQATASPPAIPCLSKRFAPIRTAPISCGFPTPTTTAAATWRRMPWCSTTRKP